MVSHVISQSFRVNYTREGLAGRSSADGLIPHDIGNLSNESDQRISMTSPEPIGASLCHIWVH